MTPILLAIVGLSLPLAHAEQPACPKPAASESVLYTHDFKWGVSLDDIGKEFDQVLSAGKRLKARAYYDASLKSYVFDSDEGPIRIDPRFLKSVTRHLEIALERRYADYVIFPDMGHSHFYIPKSEWPAISGLKGRKAPYEAMMKLRSMRILYHTAEQLRVRAGEHANEAFPQDKILLWRYFSRNVVGDNDGGENVFTLFNFETTPDYNSLGNMQGYELWSAGFNVSTSKQGCFPYQKDGKTLYFDLSLEDLPYDPNDGDGGDQ